VGPDGRVWWDGPAGVGLHGRSSAGFPKAQLAVELRDNRGLQVDADLFGMGEEADWLLNGMWIDRALLRNKLAYDLFRELSDDAQWAPETVYVELTLDGAYHGVYALVERVDRGDGRLDTPADDGTGASFVVKGAEAGIASSVQYAAWEIVYPPIVTPTVTDGVTTRLQRVEALIAARDAALWDEVDRDSAVAFVLLEELTKNNDGYYLSHHLAVGADGKLRFVPWDLDLTLGQPSYNDNENPTSWVQYRPDLIAGMGATPGFSERMGTMWAEWRATGLADGALDTRIDGIVTGLGPAVERNFARWPIGEVDFGGYLYVVGSHAEEITRVKALLAARVAWMDANVATWGEGP
ncbi:MAG: CotH kinase family protein, partial [Myxococcota bacterium]